jgi:hypothetical protein
MLAITGDTIILELTVGTCYKQNKIVLRSLCVVAEENYKSSSREERKKGGYDPM